MKVRKVRYLDLSYTIFLVLPIDTCSLPIDTSSHTNFGAVSSCSLNKDSRSQIVKLRSRSRSRSGEGQIRVRKVKVLT